MPKETIDQIKQRLSNRLFGQRLIQNSMRSDWVEAMIEPYLSETGWRYVGSDWNGWDFERGSQRLEVKQSAATQTWWFRTGKLTMPAFDIRPRTGYWDENGSRWIANKGRPAQIYVFAWHPVVPKGKPSDGDPSPVDHRDWRQWHFYVVRTDLLDPDAKTITLSKIETSLNVEAISIAELPKAIDQCGSGCLDRV